MSNASPQTSWTRPIIGLESMPQARTGLSLMAMAMVAWLAQVVNSGDTLQFHAVRYAAVHTALECAAQALSTLAFAFLWRVPQAFRRPGSVVLATMLLAAAYLDFMHMMSYEGMPPLVTPASPEKAIAFWLGGRVMLAAGLLAAAFMAFDLQLGRRLKMALLAGPAAVAAWLTWVVLYHDDALPRTFIAGSGLTAFKVQAEFVLIALYLLAGWGLLRRAAADRSGYASMLALACAFAAMGELCFASYGSVADSLNLLGHLCKIAAGWYIARATYVLSVRQPMEEARSLAGALDATVSPAMLCDLDGQVTWVNQATRMCTGFSSEQLVGRSVAQLTDDGQGVDATLAAVRANVTWRGLVTVHRQDGSTYQEVRSVTPVCDARGLTTAFVVVGDDITERARAAEAAAEAAERVRTLMDSAPDAVVVIGEHGRIENVNRQASLMFGYEAAELVGANVALLMPLDMAAQHDLSLQDDARTGNPLLTGGGRDLVARRKDGSSLHVHLKVGKASLPSGPVFVGFIRDISERLADRAELAEREARYRALMDTAADGVWILEASGRFEAVNDAYLRDSGYSRDELLRMHLEDVIGDESPDAVQARLLRVVEGGHDSNECLHRRKDGSLWPVEMSVTYSRHGRPQFFVFVRDLTQRKAAERALRESEERFQLALRGANDGLWDRDLVNDSIYYAPRWKDMLGYGDHELPNTRSTFADLLHPADALRAQMVLDECARGDGSDRFEIEMRLRHRDGHWVDVLSRGQLVRDEQGRPIRMVGTHQDLSDRRRAELAVRDSEAKLRGLFELAPLGIALCNFDGTLIEFNEAYRAITGYPCEQLRHMSYWDLTPVEYAALETEQLDLLVRTGHYGPYEKEYRRADGTLVPVRLNGVRIELDGRPRIWSIAEDLTVARRLESERAALQRQQLQSQKLEALGHLTGGIAHDFNNMLAGILGLARLGLQNHVTDANGKLARYLQEIVRTSERGRDLVAKMMAFAHVDVPVVAEARPIGPLVKELSSMLASSIPSGIRLDVDVQPGLPAVRISAVDVHQIVMNLVINARDAIGEHGRIQVRLLEDSLDNEACAACGKGISGPHVVLEVSDDGSGIPESVLPRIFDPFFTTKGVGKGTGLGLASVLGIVHNAGGHIQAGPAQPGPVGLPHPGAPAPRRGTRMRVLLPAQADFAASLDALPSATRPPSFEGASVWVVDDDPVVLIFLGELLQEHGCLVRTFADPRLALEALRTSGAPPVALITDQTMPGLSGAELARVAMQLHPGMGVILCTGYSEHVDEATAQAIGVRHFLRKPFDSHHLLEALRAELRRPPA